MATGQALSKAEVIEQGLFNDSIQGAESLIKLIRELQSEIKNNVSAQREFIATFQAKNFDDILKVNKAIAETNALLKANDKLNADAVKIEQQKARLTEAQTKQTIALNKEQLSNLKVQQAVNKENEKQAKVLGQLNSEYSQGVKRLSEIKKQLKELAFVGKDSSVVYKNLSKEFKELDARVRSAEEGVGEFQRNVGNYKSGFNGLGNSINQLSREMPAFANSVQTGFMAISNNLPIFFDEIQRTQKEIKALRAEGQQVPGLFQQLTSNILSWGTALSLGVTLLTIYGKELVEFIGKLIQGSDSIKAVNEALGESYVESTKIYEKNIDTYLKLAVVQGRISQEEADLIRNGNELKKQQFAVEQRFAAARIKTAKELGITLQQFNGQLEEQTVGTGRRSGETIILERNIKFNKAFLTLEEAKNKELAALQRGADAEARLIQEEADKKAEENRKKNIKKIKDDSNKLREQQIADELKLRNEIRQLEIEQINDKFLRKEAEADNSFRLGQEEIAASKATQESKNEALIELEKKYLNDLQKIRLEKQDEMIKEIEKAWEEEEKARLKLAIRNQKEFDKVARLAEQKKQDDLKQELELRKEIQREMFVIGQAVEARQQQQSQRNLDRIQREEQANRDAIQRQEELAAKGLENTLAFEKTKNAQLEQERARQQEKDIRNQKILSFYRIFASYADKDPATALQKAALDIALSELVSGSFIEGTEKVEKDLQGNKFSSGEDGYLVRVDGKERILNPTQNDKLGDISNDDLVSIATDYKNGKLFNYGDISQPKIIFGKSNDIKHFDRLEKKLTDIEKAIVRKPVSNFKIENSPSVKSN